MENQLSGTLTPQGHILPLRVYWEDTDAGGIVYHANYLKFMERGRTDFLRLLGVNQSALQAATGLTFAVAKMDIAFKRPAVLDDVLSVSTQFTSVGGASLTLCQQVFRGQDELARAQVTVATLRDGRAVRLPSGLKDIFSKNIFEKSGLAG
jgi:acyl-CoA thioester hydrolase